jgi:gas vesicle protein
MTDNFKSASGDAQTIKDGIKATAAKASDEAKTQAHDVMEKVTSEAANYADGAKKAAADEVKGVASALRTAADELRSGSAQERTFSQLADGLADASDAMRDKDLGEIVTAASDFAKRNPAVFLGGAVLLGFAATRFAKASSNTAGTSSTKPSYQSSAPRAAGGTYWEGSKS